jgi:heat shock protein HtpX
MDFSSYSRSNLRKTWLLIFGFLIFIILIGYLFSYLWQSSQILYLAIIFSLLMSFFSYWHSDKIVLSLTRARAMEKGEYPAIYQITENLCQKANLPLPQIYLIEEDQPNAFATGRNEKRAIVALTRGLLRKLNFSQIEGVIAHELSHIKNKDMLLSTMIVVLVGLVAILSRMFLWGTIFGQRNRGGILALLGLLAAILAPICAIIIQLAISRKREFLADASAAHITKNPEGLIQALEKIATDQTPMRTASEATAHLYISNPLKGEGVAKLFMTHPPLKERIKALRKLNF